jgi:hypothetical protein
MARKRRKIWRLATGDCSSSYVDIAIHLFFLPEFELDNCELTGEDIRQYAADIGERLATVADAVDKLVGDGWTLRVVENNIEAQHPEVCTCDDAVNRLRRLQIEDVVTDITEWSAEGDRLTPP